MYMSVSNILYVLYVFVYLFEFVGIIVRPPENTTVCEKSHVTINCGYESNTTLPVTWIINGTSFTQEEIMNSSLYQLNNATTPLNVSLKIISIKNNVTIQCLVHSTSNITSRPGTVTVISMLKLITYIYMLATYV